MKGLVIYSTQKSATRRVAEAIFDELLLDKEMATLDNVPKNLRDYDIIFVGFWMEADSPTAEGAAFLQSIEDMNVALFGAMDAVPTTEAARNCLHRNRELLPKNNTFLGGFICQAQKDANQVAKPTQGDIWGARVFAREMYYSLRS